MRFAIGGYTEFIAEIDADLRAVGDGRKQAYPRNAGVSIKNKYINSNITNVARASLKRPGHLADVLPDFCWNFVV
ncbi:hypothetical protein ETAE_1007 [Edwardsiella piscicida]|uniref:Uncharacterized protein n=1 Tax=Edwardsiella piscicida TaxID=1263550 RepID=A0AAU8P731_EDWPI|nr:hypothetical protein ETAE_1007 [Edwardsiella tarda EIB202]AGH73088.1 hypothetical protein ETAC_04805 [Edwardsiella piscicida C07-087]ARD17379.1 hypothetical protein BXA22_03005 [Edwardsiella piscicida]QBB11468.1 hypothetical protein EVK84_02330 [Edwardsiella piscicida]